MTEPADNPVPAAGVPDLLFMVDRTGRILDLKTSPRRVLRIPPERMLGHVAEDFLPAAAAQTLRAGLERTLAEGAQPSLWFTVPFPEGERTYETFILPPFGPPAPDARLAVLVCDVTDRRQAIAQLREANELLSLYIRNSPIYAYVKKVTPAGSVVVQASENFREMIGIPGSEMVGKNMAELFPAELAAQITADDWAVVSNGEVRQIEEELNGRTYATIKYPIVQGGQTLLAGYTQDVTARKQTLAALQQSEAQYRLLFENAGDAIYILDTNGRILAANPAASQQTGYANAELAAMNIAQVNAPEFSSRVPERMEKLIREGHLEHETMLRRKDGALFPVEVKTKLHTWNGQPAALSFVRDVSARKEAEAALRESEAKYQSLFKSIRDAFVSVDMQGRILEHNAAYEELTGYSAEELRHLTYVELTPKKWHAREAQIVAEQVLPNGFSEVYEKEYRRKDGTLVPIELRTILIRDAAGGPAGMWATVRDITARKRADRFLRLVLDNVPNAVFWKDRNSVFLGCNQNLARAAGLDSPEQIVGKTDYDMGWKKEESDFFVATDRRIMETNRAEYHIVEPQRQADGKEAWLDTCKIPLHDEQGRVIGILGAFEDITERLRMQRELKDNAADLERRVQARTAELEASRAQLALREERFREMAEGVQEMFWLADVQTQRFLYVSPAFQAIWGRPVATVLQNPAIWLEHVHADDRARTTQAFLQGMKTGEFEPIEYRVVRPDGSVRWVAGNGWGIRAASGQIVRAAGLTRDITEHRRLESEVLNAGETERRRIGRDLHDGLSQALTAIGYWAEAVRNNLASADRPEAADVQKLVDWIGKTGKQARRMAQGLLLTDLKRGGLLPALQELALTTQELFGVDCRFRGPDAITLPSREVAQQLYRIAQEAATNAAKHSKGKLIDVCLERTPDGIRLSIRDDGRGLPEVAGARAGMGLEIMQYRAGLIGATLAIESAPGRGATVTCLVPVAAAPPRKKTP